MRSIVLPISDTHCGLKVGLMPTKVVDRDSVYYQTDAQQWLWKRWLQARRIIFKELEQADELVVFLMGDSIHGSGRADEVFSTRLKTQKDTYIDCLLPYTNRATACYCVKGTEWHVGEDGIVEDQAAQELGCYGLKAYDKLEVEVQGIKFMLQHKGPSPGIYRHTKGNVMRAMLRDAYFATLEQSREPADIYLWGHYHEYVPESLMTKDKELYGYILPAWCVANEYALTHVKNLELSDIGMIYFVIEDGRWELKTFIKSFDNVERVKHAKR